METNGKLESAWHEIKLTVQHNNACDERLSETSGEGDKGVVGEAIADDFILILSLRMVSRVDVCLDSLGVVAV